MLFVDTNNHLKTIPSNFDIKCQSNSESYEQHGFLGPSLGVVRIFLNYGGRFFQRERTFSYIKFKFGFIIETI